LGKSKVTTPALATSVSGNYCCSLWGKTPISQGILCLSEYESSTQNFGCWLGKNFFNSLQVSGYIFIRIFIGETP